jgi:predicted RNase H-like HicB family nuclease
MADHHYIPIKGSRMTTYIFKVVVEPDEDKWSAYCPALLKQGAATWGDTEEEALRHIHEVVEMVVQTLLEDGEPIPKDVRGCQDNCVTFFHTGTRSPNRITN